jgi:flavin reductase (DIM6/NTAB) family NADH-FMN oxidoreductase RutF
MSTGEDFKRDYRDTVGLFATGVTVVLAEKDGEVRGMTANAVTSVSLEPTLLLFCPAKKASIAEICEVGMSFTVNILGADQEATSNHYAGADMAPFHDVVDWKEAGGVPRIEGCIAALACRIWKIYDGGDHWIVVGEVVAMHRDDDPADPLLFHSGTYRRLAAANE